MTTQPSFHVFLSHSSADKPAVEYLASQLRESGLEPFLDKWHLIPGEPWQEALEAALDESSTCAVFIGPGGLGAWANEEMRAALEERVRTPAFRVIPVLLPDAQMPERGRLPRFLRRLTWVDFRQGLEDSEPLHRLICGIRGIAPGSTTTAGAATTPEKVVCPYRGLEPFEEEHAEIFFGRESLTQWLVEALRRFPFLAVIGPSGSGKSSVVKAGLIPALRGGALPSSEHWTILAMRPGDRPLEELALQLSALRAGDDRVGSALELQDALRSDERALHSAVRLGLADQRPDASVLLLIDQFEELFTHDASENERRLFLDNLLYATSVANARTVVVLTLRADFYSQAAAHPGFADRIADHQMLLSPMDETELRQAIEAPAAHVGLEFEPGLVDRILAEVVNEPGGLPLLQFALTELWSHHAGRLLTNAGYDATGGARQAIARRAESEFEALPAELRSAARRVFTDLVHVARTEEASRDTRRRATLAGFDDPARELVSRLAAPGTRLLVTGRNEKNETVVELAHEALIEGWDRLGEWLDEDREFLLWRQRLQAAVNEHAHSGALLAGTSLAVAERWLEERRRSLSDGEIALIDASTTAREQVVRTEARRRRTLVASGLGIALLIAALGANSVRLGRASQRQLALARATSVLVSAAGTQDPAVAALLVLEADELMAKASPVSLAFVSNLHQTAANLPPVSILLGHQHYVLNAAFSPDGTRVVTASYDGTARVWNANGSGEPVVLQGHRSSVWGAVFSPDGTRVVTASSDNTARVWNANGSGEPVVLRGHQADVLNAAFSPDGTRIVTASEDDTARVWNADGSGQPIVLQGHHFEVYSAAFSPDGTQIVTASEDDTARVWNADGSGESVVLRGHQGIVLNAAFSPDGTRVVTASWDNTACVWNANGSGQPIVLQGHQSLVRSAAFSPDGTRIVTASEDDTARVWNADGSGQPVVLQGHQDNVLSAAFSLDGTRIVTASDDDTARVWNADGSGQPVVLQGHQNAVRSAAFSPDGSRVVTASSDTTARVWNANGSREPVVLQGHQSPMWGATFSPDGTRVVTTTWDNTARVWNADGSGQPVVLQGHQDDVSSAAFSLDGTRIVTASDDHTARVWNADGSGQPVVLLGHQDDVSSAAFSPDGTRVVTASYDGTARVWKADGSGEPVVLQGHHLDVYSAAFSPDGTRIVTASDDDTARVWNTDGSGQPVVLLGHNGSVTSAAFSSDGTRIVTASWDNTARVWSADGSGQSVVLQGHQSPVTSAAFSPDGTRVVTVTSDNTARVWNADGSGQPVVLRGHNDSVASAAFSPDGTRVVTASWDNTARVWSADGSGESVVLQGHQNAVRSAAFSLDGTRIVTASSDSTARVWRVSWRPLVEYFEEAVRGCLTPEQRIRYLGEIPSVAEDAYAACKERL